MKKIATKDKILEAAKTLFVAHGFAGTSIGTIAKTAEVNHSLIFHHFKNKEQLWLAVKQSIVQQANSKIKNLPETDLSFAEFLKILFTRNLAFYHSNQDLIRMLSWQRLEHQSVHNIGVTMSDDMLSWVAAFKQYQEKGDIKPGLKPEWIVIMILSIISSAALDPNALISEPASLQEYIDFCVESLLVALSGN